MDSGFPPLDPIAQSEHFETERLLVRRTVGSDGDLLRPTLESPGLVRGLRLDEPPNPQEFINQAVAGWEFPWTYEANFTFTLIEKARQQAVGYAAMHVERNEDGGLRIEPDIVISPDFYRKGYAYEAMSGLIGWAFDDIEYPDDVVIDEVKALCLPSNSASIGLLEKLAEIGMEDLGLQEVPLRRRHQGEEPTITVRVFRVTRTGHRL
jgi:RimJ/RimL family protein N-acetyltransferase